MIWTVHVVWQAYGYCPGGEVSTTSTDWSTARRQALHLTCSRGARYVTLTGPGDVVVADWDRYTNRWREYLRTLAVLGAVAGAAPTQ
ncbi:hypothetical protein ACIA7R_31415 [Micromonospora chalcea]